MYKFLQIWFYLDALSFLYIFSQFVCQQKLHRTPLQLSITKAFSCTLYSIRNK